MIAASFYAPRAAHERHRYDFLECLRVQAASCARFGVEQLVITDTELPGLPWIATDLPDDLMHAIIAGQLALLRSGIDDDLILIGADGLLTRDPAEIFDGTADLIVTTHPFDDCILNTGLIGVPRGQAEAVAPIWERALARCGPHWGDDQRALAAEINPTLRHGVELREGLRVRFLPVPGYNDAPDDVGHRIDSLVVHFRGPRKTWMADWARRHAGL